jgi:hypothetical protein
MPSVVFSESESETYLLVRKDTTKIARVNESHKWSLRKILFQKVRVRVE